MLYTQSQITHLKNSNARTLVIAIHEENWKDVWSCVRLFSRLSLSSQEINWCLCVLLEALHKHYVSDTSTSEASMILSILVDSDRRTLSYCVVKLLIKQKLSPRILSPVAARVGWSQHEISSLVKDLDTLLEKTLASSE